MADEEVDWGMGEDEDVVDLDGPAADVTGKSQGHSLLLQIYQDGND